MEDISPKTILIMLLLRKEKVMGRYRLKEVLDMRDHEGVIRRILEDLARRKWVKATRSGTQLTEEGDKALVDIMSSRRIVEAKELDLNNVGIGRESIVIQMRNRHTIRSVVALRDVAVTAGARGAVILTYKGEKLDDLSAYRRLSFRHPQITRSLENSLALQEGDIVIVAFADDYPKALQGALAVGFAVDKSEIKK
jgi:RIO-like serine/threonine protein kinase